MISSVNRHVSGFDRSVSVILASNGTLCTRSKVVLLFLFFSLKLTLKMLRGDDKVEGQCSENRPLRKDLRGGFRCLCLTIRPLII